MTPISTKIPLDYFLLKTVTDVETVPKSVPSLNEYYFNAQTNLVFRRTKKINFEIFETISKFSWKGTINVEE